jgi:hypothetical protein
VRKTNPFPGMNPWLEEHWPGVHTRLIAYLADAIAAKLPDDLSSMPEEGVSISADDCDEPHTFRADVAVKETWQDGVAPAWSPDDDAELEARAAIPTIVQAAPMTERWVEIREAGGRLITVIEILSPGNKTGGGLAAYLEKRRLLLESPINLVEIDLLLGGRPAFPEGFVKLPPLEETHYVICTKRAGTGTRREILRPLLREPLPVIRIPLRKGEKDVFIDLQTLVNQVHEVGRYHMLDYRRLPETPLPPTDQEWLRERVVVA